MAPCQLADRAFGAQRFSGGRAGGAPLRAAFGGGWRFAPPFQDVQFKPFPGLVMEVAIISPGIVSHGLGHHWARNLVIYRLLGQLGYNRRNLQGGEAQTP